MPLNVKLRIALWSIAALAAFLVLFYVDWALGFLFLGTVLLFIEMIYPKWNFFGRAVTDVKSKGPGVVSITFDDGPSEWTLKILDVLKNEKVRASFFLVGANVERHPEIARRIYEDGHDIGFHSYSHTKLHLKGPAFIRNEFEKNLKAFERAGIRDSGLVRFPHGFKNFFAVREAKMRNLKICGWGRGVWDSRKPGVDHIVKYSLNLKEGEILLLHDGHGARPDPDRSQTVEALPQIIQGLRQKGFRFVGLS